MSKVVGKDPIGEILRDCKGCLIGMRIANQQLFDKVLIEEVCVDFGYMVVSGQGMKRQIVQMSHIISINADDIPT